MAVLYRHARSTVTVLFYHEDSTISVGKLSGTFRLTHIIQISFYGELIMYSCSTALKNTYSKKYANSTMSSFCAKTTYILLCVICFCILIFRSRLFKFFFVQLLRAISFVKFISRNMVCSIWFLKFVLCNLLFACFVQFTSWNLCCAICFGQHCIAPIAFVKMTLKLWNVLNTWTQTGELLELLLHLKAEKFGKMLILEFGNLAKPAGSLYN